MHNRGPFFQLFYPEREIFTQCFRWLCHHRSAVVMLWCGRAGPRVGEREQRDPLSALWLTRDSFQSSVLSFCYLCCCTVPCIRPILRSKPEERENTHGHAHMCKKVATPLLVIPQALTFLPFILTTYFLESANCWFLYFIPLPSVYSVTDTRSNELRQVWSTPEVLSADFEMVFFGPVFFIQV